MKRIEFIAPVSAMRGNLSGGQRITYDGGKRAYDVSGSYAHGDSYDKSYIGAKNYNKKKYFALRTKSDIALGSDNRLAMAAFGGACSLGREARHSLTILTSLQQVYKGLKEQGRTDKGFAGWVQSAVYPMLKEKQTSVTLTDGFTSVVINNPWKTGGSGTDVNVPAEILAKFQSVLG